MLGLSNWLFMGKGTVPKAVSWGNTYLMVRAAENKLNTEPHHRFLNSRAFLVLFFLAMRLKRHYLMLILEVFYSSLFSVI